MKQFNSPSVASATQHIRTLRLLCESTISADLLIGQHIAVSLRPASASSAVSRRQTVAAVEPLHFLSIGPFRDRCC